MIRFSSWFAAGLALAACHFPSVAADLTARQVTQKLFGASAEAPVDFSGRDLTGLDLAGLGFKRARLAKTDMFGADLSGADLTGADLSAARLDRVNAIGTRFDGAKLIGASLLRPTTTTSFDFIKGEAPTFAGADLSNARMFGNFVGGSFAGARMVRITLAPANDTGFIEMLWRSRLDSADLSGADLSGADLTHVSLRFANLRGATLAGAVLKHADLAHADLTNADLTGADLTDADLDRTTLSGVKGLDRALGMTTARNRDKALN